MTKKLVLMSALFLSACSQSEQKHSNQQQKVETQKKVDKAHSQIEESIPAQPEALDLPIATFAFQTDGDQIIPKNCVWTDDAHAEGKSYWAISASSEINGNSQFSKEDLQVEKVKLGQVVKNCQSGFATETQKYAYAISREGDLVNFIALKPDRLMQNKDHRYSIDLNKNGKAEKVYVCYNTESLDAFFIDSSTKHPDLHHVNVQLSFSIDGGIEEDISCGDVFYKKSGIIAKENAQTGEFSYSVK